LAALLPASDVLVIADVPRAMRDLVPRLKALDIGDIERIANEVENFARLSGVDLQKLGAVAIGLKLNGLSIASGTLAVAGIEADAKRIETAAIAAKWQFETIDVGGKTIYRLSRLKATEATEAPATNGAAPAPPPKIEEIFFALPGGGRLIAGDQMSVKSAILATTPAPENLGLRASVKEAKGAAIARFSAQLPADLKTMLESQGDLFKQLAAVKAIFGSLDLAASGDAAIDARLRTGSGTEATEMETSLKSLVFLGKSFLGSSQDPKMVAINQLIDQIKIVTQASDVTLSLTISKALLEQWSKK
jgi:hypothetical protein